MNETYGADETNEGEWRREAGVGCGRVEIRSEEGKEEGVRTTVQREWDSHVVGTRQTEWRLGRLIGHSGPKGRPPLPSFVVCLCACVSTCVSARV